MSTPYHACYYSHNLQRRSAGGEIDRLSMSLFDASVDLTPHQVDAALFVFQSPLSKGVILADEVGLGKTIEAGLALCQLWAERKRRLFILEISQYMQCRTISKKIILNLQIRKCTC